MGNEEFTVVYANGAKKMPKDHPEHTEELLASTTGDG